MLNSLATYIWRSSADPMNGYADVASLEAEGEQLNLDTQQDEDWVVVGTEADMPGPVPGDGGEMEGENQAAREDSPGAENRVAAPRRQGALHAAGGMHNVVITQEQVLRQIHNGRLAKYRKEQKSVSKQKMDRQNIVRHLTSHDSKGKNRQNKCVRPSGCKAGRVGQRM